jgi:hypothetical protein
VALPGAAPSGGGGTGTSRTAAAVTYDLRQGDSLDLVLSWGRSHRHHRFDAAAMLQGTAAAWRQWMTHFSYEGLQEPLVRRGGDHLKAVRPLGQRLAGRRANVLAARAVCGTERPRGCVRSVPG